MAIAASLLLLISIIFPLFILNQDEQEFATTYGETQNFELPDGSEVILNANSSLRFIKDWQEKEQRQVWLEGEAFFKVSKLISSDSKEAVKFIVHLQDIDVEVVGTAFNVNHRSGKVEVTLDEGIVDLKMTGGERLRMEPGDMVAYSAETQRLDKFNVNPQKVTAWRNHQMMLDEQPLSELAVLIENYYGVKVRFSSDELADKKIKATLPTDNLDLVLETLELMLDVQLERNENEIIMK
jgi:ferric-dicitrate binding protein FerR (iron transport regulator)